MSSSPSWAFLQHFRDKHKDNACACSLESGSHRAPNHVLLLKLSPKDMSELLYLFLLYLPTHTCVRGSAHARLRPRGCNQGNVLANLLCSSNPKGGWVMMHYNNYTPHTEHTHTWCLCCCVVVHSDTQTLKRNRAVSQFHLQHISSAG